MIKYEKFDGTKTYMFPNSEIATSDIIRMKFAAVDLFTHIIETDENSQVCFAVMNLSAIRSQRGIPKELTEDEAIQLLQEQANAPQSEPEPSAEDRIAAALEYQNLLSM